MFVDYLVKWRRTGAIWEISVRVQAYLPNCTLRHAFVAIYVSSCSRTNQKPHGKLFCVMLFSTLAKNNVLEWFEDRQKPFFFQTIPFLLDRPKIKTLFFWLGSGQFGRLTFPANDIMKLYTAHKQLNFTQKKLALKFILRNYQKGPKRQNSVFIPLIWFYTGSPRQPLNVDGNHQILLLLLNQILAIMPRSPGHYSVPVSPFFITLLASLPFFENNVFHKEPKKTTKKPW